MATLGGSSNRGVSNFDYVGSLFDQQDYLGGTSYIRADGGNVAWYFGGTASPTWADIYGIDTSADNQAIQQGTSNLNRTLGVLVGWVANGRPVFGPNCFATEFGTFTAGASRIFVQISGKAYVVADGTISRGDIVTASTTTAGRVTSNNSATVGTILGRALTATTGAGQQVLISIRPQ